jgi:hypothetical protein
MLLITNVPLHKGFWTKVAQGYIGKFKVTQNIQKKNQILTFLHRTIKDTDTGYSEVTGNICNTLDMGPGGQPHPPPETGFC